MALTCLSEALGNLDGLATLQLSGCQALARLPESTGQMATLRVLGLDSCVAMTCLPESVGQLPALEVLSLRACALTSLPQCMGQLTALASLGLPQSSALTCLPQSIGQLAALTSLDLSHCSALTCPPKSIGRLTALASLNMSGCHALACLPETVGQLTMLTSLDLSHCNTLTCLPESVGLLTALTLLDLSRCRALTCLPVSVGQLTALTFIGLRDCEMVRGLPESLGHLLALNHLALRGCRGLTCLPESLGQLTALTSLDLCDWQSVTQLPESLGQLKHLENLRLCACLALTGLPDSIGHLFSLRLLDLRDCSALTHLPESLGSLPFLREIDTTGCKNLVSLPPHPPGLPWDPEGLWLAGQQRTHGFGKQPALDTAPESRSLAGRQDTEPPASSWAFDLGPIVPDTASNSSRELQARILELSAAVANLEVRDLLELGHLSYVLSYCTSVPFDERASRVAEGIRAVQRAVQLDTTLAVGHHLLGRLLWRKGGELVDFILAKAALEAAEAEPAAVERERARVLVDLGVVWVDLLCAPLLDKAIDYLERGARAAAAAGDTATVAAACAALMNAVDDAALRFGDIWPDPAVVASTRIMLTSLDWWGRRLQIYSEVAEDMSQLSRLCDEGRLPVAVVAFGRIMGSTQGCVFWDPQLASPDQWELLLLVLRSGQVHIYSQARAPFEEQATQICLNHDCTCKKHKSGTTLGVVIPGFRADAHDRRVTLGITAGHLFCHEPDCTPSTPGSGSTAPASVPCPVFWVDDKSMGTVAEAGELNPSLSGQTLHRFNQVNGGPDISSFQLSAPVPRSFSVKASFALSLDEHVGHLWCHGRTQPRHHPECDHVRNLIDVDAMLAGKPGPDPALHGILVRGTLIDTDQYLRSGGRPACMHRLIWVGPPDWFVDGDCGLPLVAQQPQREPLILGVYNGQLRGNPSTLYAFTAVNSLPTSVRTFGSARGANASPVCRIERFDERFDFSPVSRGDRLHWMPDDARETCPRCQRPFTLFRRRHHCRRCGTLACDDCAPETAGIRLCVVPCDAAFPVAAHSAPVHAVTLPPNGDGSSAAQS